MCADTSFKLTYATMFNPPQELHDRYDQELARVKASIGKEYGMIIDGKERYVAEKFENRSPINTDWVLGIFQKGSAPDAQDAVEAARRAFPMWSHMPWQERVALVRKAADIMDRRIYEMGVSISLEVGKNRMEALGDVAETADLLRYSCDRMEVNNGYVAEMGSDPLVGFVAANKSVLRPYGVWLVISPFNFPASLTGGPAGAALVAGNTVITKPATDTPWAARLIAECMLEAGIPAGVYNYVTGPGSTLGQALIEHPDVAGVTFTGSYDVGMKIFRDSANRSWIRPVILELGGKNPAIVSRNADLEDAAMGISRSAFGLQGQKCSACSRVYVEAPVYDQFVSRLVELTNDFVIGDPTDREVYFGPVINRNSYRDFQNYVEELSQHGRTLTGGEVLTGGNFGRGYFVSPTLVDNLPLDHPLWKFEMFEPITTIARVKDLEEAMRLANDVNYGLTAGFYGTAEEADWFFDHIEAGVTYSNRPQGSTTGAWPGFQPFGGWKGSGSSGKNSGGLYYLPLYMHEQIHTRIRRA
jgi:1-pyrroline-5-carboxylate dehydrogenase